MSANKTVAQRLGRVLETVTRQSGRLPETPAYGSLLLGRVTESQTPPAGPHPDHHDRAYPGGEPDRHRRRAAAGDGRHSRAERVRRRAAWITFGVAPAYIALALAVGTYWITRRDGDRAALGDRGAQTQPRRRAQHLPGPVANRDRRPHPVGRRDGAVDHPLRPGQHACSSRGSCSRWASAASWSPPAAICSPSSRCARWPLRHSRRDQPPRRLAPGIMGRTMMVWLLGSGVPGHRHRPGGDLPDIDAESDRDAIRGRRC